MITLLTAAHEPTNMGSGGDRMAAHALALGYSRTLALNDSPMPSGVRIQVLCGAEWGSTSPRAPRNDIRCVPEARNTNRKEPLLCNCCGVQPKFGSCEYTRESLMYTESKRKVLLTKEI